MPKPRSTIPKPRPTISLARRLEAARRWLMIFAQAAASYERDGMTEQAMRASDVAATWQERIEELKAKDHGCH